MRERGRGRGGRREESQRFACTATINEREKEVRGARSRWRRREEEEEIGGWRGGRKTHGHLRERNNTWMEQNPKKKRCPSRDSRGQGVKWRTLPLLHTVGSMIAVTHSQCPLLAAYNGWILSKPHVTQVGCQHFGENTYAYKAVDCRCGCTTRTEVWIIVKFIKIRNFISTSH